ncbi:hypothetical protein ACJA88_014841 [Fusarium oxysporum]
MDHLPIPVDPECPLPKVPWLGMMYDGHGIHRYPERMGWTRVNHNGLHYLLRGDELEEDEVFEMAFHQAWLWTALLVDIMRTYDVVTNFSDFTTPRFSTEINYPGTVIYLTTQHLPAYLKEMASRDQSFPIGERENRLANALAILAEAVDFASCCAGAGGLHSSSLSDEIALSMARDFFDETANGISQDMKQAFQGFSQLKSKLLRLKLQSSGWCRSSVALLEDHLDVENVLYASMLQRKGPVRDHSQCSDHTCVAYQIEEGVYQTRHVNGDCGCDFVMVDVTSVDRILQNDGIPAVMISAHATLEVVDVARGSLPYVCISHVWSDGLGNEKVNALPRCQLQRLREMCNRIQVGGHADRPSSVEGHSNLRTGSAGDQMLIWIDTLCVPVNSNRRLALEAIGRTFKEAEVVLVIDLELTSVSLSTRWQELCLRVGLSGWSRRLWTFQEAALAKDRLYFQFKEGPLDLWRETIDSLTQGLREPSFRNTSDQACMLFFRRCARPYFEDDSFLFTFLWMAQSLRFRTTSKQKDEPFCLASSLSLDPSRILQFSTIEERMREFWRILPEMPSTLFFLSCARLQFPGYRWAPRTFLEPLSNPVWRWRGEGTTRIARWDENAHGLRVCIPGYLLSFATPLMPEDKKRGLVIWVRKSTSLEDSFNATLRSEEDYAHVCGLSEVILIIENDVDLPLSCLVHRIGEEQNVVSVEYLFAVDICPVKEMINWESIDADKWKWQAECTKEYSEDQTWCIG